MVRKDYPLICDLLHKKISLNLGSVFEIDYGYPSIWTIKFVIGKYIRDSITAVDEIIDN